MLYIKCLQFALFLICFRCFPCQYVHRSLSLIIMTVGTSPVVQLAETVPCRGTGSMPVRNLRSCMLCSVAKIIRITVEYPVLYISQFIKIFIFWHMYQSPMVIIMLCNKQPLNPSALKKLSITACSWVCRLAGGALVHDGLDGEAGSVSLPSISWDLLMLMSASACFYCSDHKMCKGASPIAQMLIKPWVAHWSWIFHCAKKITGSAPLFMQQEVHWVHREGHRKSRYSPHVNVITQCLSFFIIGSIIVSIPMLPVCTYNWFFFFF